MNSQLQEQIVRLVAGLAPPALAEFSSRLEKLYTGVAEAEIEGVIDYVSPPAVRHRLREFISAWRAVAPAVDPATMAVMLQAAAAMDEERRREQSIELVWTGPAEVGSVLRRTDQALLELIEAAEKTLVIVTFAAYRVTAVVKALRDAHARGVDISLILETVLDSGGKLSHGALEGLGAEVLSLARVYTWPVDRRPRDNDGNVCCLHVKCAVADAQTALVSSANLTGFALSINMELGVLVKGGSLPRQLARHLQDLMAGRQLTRLSPAPRKGG